MTRRAPEPPLTRAARCLKWADDVYVNLKTKSLTPVELATAGGALTRLTSELDELEAIPTTDRNLTDVLRYARAQVAESKAFLARAEQIRTLPRRA
jgi:hypothetical protein